MNCPKCKDELIKNKKHGENVWFCKKCEISWFIVLSRNYKEKK